MSLSRITFEESAPSPYAGFWRRLGASVVDTLILLPGLFVLAWMFWPPSYVGANQFQFSAGFYVLGGLMIAGYRVGFESSLYQATLGKQALGIMVTDLGGHLITPKTALIRNWTWWAGSLLEIIDILFGATAAFGGAGFFGFFGAIAITVSCVMVAFTERKQGAHDIMAGCLVVRKGARFEPPPPGSRPPGLRPPGPAEAKPLRGAGALPTRPLDR
jgi:uncharacterized RDD family membrane protein YckC